MSGERESEIREPRFYGHEALHNAPPAFQKRIEKTRKHVRDQGGFQMMLQEEPHPELIPFKDKIYNVFVLVEGIYRESFHKVNDQAYRVLITGIGSEEQTDAIMKALGASWKRSEVLSQEIAQKERYPLRYRLPD